MQDIWHYFALRKPTKSSLEDSNCIRIGILSEDSRKKWMGETKVCRWRPRYDRRRKKKSSKPICRPTWVEYSRDISFGDYELNIVLYPLSQNKTNDRVLFHCVLELIFVHIFSGNFTSRTTLKLHKPSRVFLYNILTQSHYSGCFYSIMHKV